MKRKTRFQDISGNALDKRSKQARVGQVNDVVEGASKTVVRMPASSCRAILCWSKKKVCNVSGAPYEIQKRTIWKHGECLDYSAETFAEMMLNLFLVVSDELGGVPVVFEFDAGRISFLSEYDFKIETNSCVAKYIANRFVFESKGPRSGIEEFETFMSSILEIAGLEGMLKIPNSKQQRAKLYFRMFK